MLLYIAIGIAIPIASKTNTITTITIIERTHARIVAPSAFPNVVLKIGIITSAVTKKLPIALNICPMIGNGDSKTDKMAKAIPPRITIAIALPKDRLFIPAMLAPQSKNIAEADSQIITHKIIISKIPNVISMIDR